MHQMTLKVYCVYRHFSLNIKWNFESQTLHGNLMSANCNGEYIVSQLHYHLHVFTFCTRLNCTLFQCLCAYSKNTHGVPRSTLERMMDHYEHHVSVETVMGYNKTSSLSSAKKLVYFQFVLL